MRILFISQLLPLPLNAGPKIRAYYVLRYLAEAGHHVSLLCFVRPGESEQNIQRLRRICSSVETVLLTRSRAKDLSDGFKSLFSPTPFLIRRDQVALMSQKCNQLMGSNSFDAVHADQLWMASYGMNCTGPRLKVLDQHNAVCLVPRRMAEHQPNPFLRALLRKEAEKLEAFERTACARFDRVVWVTEEDRKAVGRQGEHQPNHSRVIPIATDPSSRRPLRRSQPFRVTFVGGMHWPPNSEGISWFADKVWPKVSTIVPSAVLTLIGKGTPKRLLRQGSTRNVEVPGYISDLNQYLSETAVFVVPIRSAAGMRVKILDAWCWGLPVVSTSTGAEGINGVHGENLLIANDEDSFADGLMRLMREPALARRLSQNGRATVETMYDWKKVYEAWDEIYH